jgi:GTP-binding protein
MQREIGEKLMFKKATFLLSASSKEHFPEFKTEDGRVIPEIAFVGRSNVGKSSLLNHLTQNRNLAHISSKPGKTRLVNFFSLDDQMILVDLPGYGFAKVSKKIQSEWGELMEDYLNERTSLQLILHLIDSRHPPTKEDLMFAHWASHFGKPFLTVFTKTDKMKRGALESQCRNSLGLLANEVGSPLTTYVPYSIKDAKARIHLMKEIQKRI